MVGGGLTGLIATAVLAQAGHEVHLVAPKAASKDGRTTAMLNPTVEMLDAAGLWDGIEEHSAALKTMRLIDGSKRLLRAPITDFEAAEVGLDAFGHNVPNNLMCERVEQVFTNMANVQRHAALVSAAEVSSEGVTLQLDDGTELTVPQVIAADGRNSVLREAAGISTRSWSYPQTALVTTFAHSLPHGGVSAEFHTESGPFTQVPLPSIKGTKHRSSLVWVVKPEDAHDLIDLDIETLSMRIEDRLQSSFGKVTAERGLQAFPLTGLTANRFAAKGVALVGEAGHVFPPIGAQGFNLAARDISDVIATLADQEPGTEAFARAYNSRRLADVNLRTTGVDIMNRSLLTDFLPVQAGRVAGIAALRNIEPLRRFAMRQGLGAR
ncbi:2-octaprenyl-6-methoxyphenyl hydroxylase [Ahrensia sp. R2A130]|nr:2-octaprenyl-6-methoxyphenyl hydroxylase [Ahrensia sp. R2A130]